MMSVDKVLDKYKNGEWTAHYVLCAAVTLLNELPIEEIERRWGTIATEIMKNYDEKTVDNVLGL